MTLFFKSNCILFIGFAFMVVNFSYSQEKSYMTNHHIFKNEIFKNPDSALQHINLIKKYRERSNSLLPNYFYHQDLGQYYFFTRKMDSSEHHYKKAYKIGLATKIDTLIINSNIWLANHEYFKGEIEKCHNRYQIILKKSKKANYLEGITTAHAMFASLEENLNKKMKLFLKIDSLYQVENKQSSLLARVYASIAEIYLDAQGNNKLAVDYIEKSLEISKKVNYPPAKYEAKRLLIKLALQDKNYDKAISLYHKVLKQGITYNDPTAKNIAMLGLAKMFFEKGNLKETEKQLKKGAYLLELPEESPLFGYVHLLWTEYYLEINNKKKALEHLEKAKGNPDLTDKLSYSIELSRIEIKYYESIKKFKKAYLLKKDYDIRTEYLFKQRNTNGFILSKQLELKEKSEKEITLLKTQSEVVQEQTKNQRNLLIGGIGLTSIAGVFLFLLYRNRQKTNKKLLEIDALKTNFFTNLSHEFRTPLTLISTPIQESLNDPNTSKEKREHFKIAHRNTERLTLLVDQLLELSKIDSGNRKLYIEKTTPTQLIAFWMESFIYLGEQKNIEFKTEILNKEQVTWCDKEALETIITNLLGNAIKYTPEDGEIIVKALITNNVLKFKISNTGKGLTKNQTKTILNRFYQTNDYNEGVGVGLSLVKELTDLHNGSIKVESKLNDWTTFTVLIVLDKSKLKNVVLKESTNSVQKVLSSLPKTESNQDINFTDNNELPLLLIVEDNADVRFILNNTFKDEYQVVQTNNGEQGILKALELVPDIIISDLMMPIKDGIELTKTLKKDERTSHIPIVLLTAKAGDENELIGIDVGADDYITKPFNQKILISKTASLIASRKKLQSRYSQEVILKPKDIAITFVDELFLKKVQEVLDNSLTASNFTIEEFSKTLHMSRMQLHRKLKALTGLSASEFIKSQRLKLAVKVLKESDINISEVGYSVGFNDHAYFSKCFKETYNCTPSEFTKKQ